MAGLIFLFFYAKGCYGIISDFTNKERNRTFRTLAPPGFEPGSSVPKTDRIGHYPTGLRRKKDLRPPGFEPGFLALSVLG